MLPDSDIFLELADIEGESQDSKHRNEIDLLAAGFGAKATFSRTGGGSGSGKTNFGPLCITKLLDKSTPKLLDALAKGKHIESALVTFRKAGSAPVEFLKYKLEDLIVTSYSVGSGDSRPYESCSLEYSKIHLEYVEQDDKGGTQPAVVFEWDLAKNAPP